MNKQFIHIEIFVTKTNKYGQRYFTAKTTMSGRINDVVITRFQWGGEEGFTLQMVTEDLDKKGYLEQLNVPKIGDTYRTISPFCPDLKLLGVEVSVKRTDELRQCDVKNAVK